MKNNSNTLGLHNMNGLSADDKRTCALNDMNCRAGQPEQTASLQDMNAANEQPGHGLQHHEHELPQGLTHHLPRLYAQACRRGLYICPLFTENYAKKEVFP